ncbi:MAG: NAD-dependent epimerase/dehydratase family protein [Betaproteobacteria bacterium]|nr:NAD-dependent epimerase/dehydratase family protein [Betaproteobacteria bacterium]MDE2621705.1 NAD-dependent epimerase/dehydratase family protein [Betaproteobacteria bacterium]
MQRWLIIGSGDVARRMVPLIRAAPQLFALCRDDISAARWRSLGATPLMGDLDKPATLGRLSGLAHVVFHFAPPASDRPGDPRTKHLITALERGASLPHTLVYISTTGVYGDCRGALVDECTPVRPTTARASRRVEAETLLRGFGTRSGCHVSILRAPGIYAEDRLPLERLHRQDPLAELQSDPWTNHIHARDLAQAALDAARRARPNRIYNVADDSRLRMGEFYEMLARHFGLPLPARLPLEEVRRKISEISWSFMAESRQVSNSRIKREFRRAWYYPTIDHFLKSIAPVKAVVSNSKR